MEFYPPERNHQNQRFLSALLVEGARSPADTSIEHTIHFLRSTLKLAAKCFGVGLESCNDGLITIRGAVRC